MATKLGMVGNVGFLNLVDGKPIVGRFEWSVLHMKDGEEKRGILTSVDGETSAWLPGHSHLAYLLAKVTPGTLVRLRCVGQVKVATPMGAKQAFRYEGEALDASDSWTVEETDLTSRLADRSVKAKKNAEAPF